MLEMRALALNAQLREIIACLRAKQAQDWQHGWVAVEKHEMHRWTTR